MAKAIYTVIEVSDSKRSSDRVYTHAVIGQHDPAVSVAFQKAEAKSNAVRNRRWDAKNWNDHKRESEAIVGDVYINHNNYRVIAADYVVESGKKFMAENPTLEGYLKRLEDEQEARWAQSLLQPKRPMEVLRWSMSEQNAVKAVVGFSNHYSNLRVVPIVRVK